MRYKPKTEAEWLKLRKTCLTATEMGSILGVNRFQSAEKMWENKLHGTFKGNAYTFMGHLLEPVVIDLVNTVLKRQYVQCEQGDVRLFLANKKIGLGATPDAEDKTSFLECKTTKPSNYVRYSITPPDSYVVQAAVQLLLDPKKELAHLAILNTDLSQDSPELHLPLTIYEISRVPAFEKLLMSEAARFWECKKNKKKFRSCSKVKNQTEVLCRLCCKKLVPKGDIMTTEGDK